MQKFNMQELISLTNERIKITKQQEEEERVRKQQEENRQKKLNAEELALSIQKMILDILKNCKDNSGLVSELGDISKYGTPTETNWSLDESKFQIVLDFSYSIPGDCLGYNGPRGFKIDSIDWEYLCKLLQDNGIIIKHDTNRTEIKEEGWYGRTDYTDVLTISVGQVKSKSEDDKETIHNFEYKDLFTDYGKGIRYKTCDGKEVATMEEVMAYNQNYYDNMMIMDLTKIKSLNNVVKKDDSNYMI